MDTMTLSEELKEHEAFFKVTKSYIIECLKNGSSPEQILEGYRMIIDETMKELK